MNHYFSEQQNIEFKLKKIEVIIKNKRFKLYTSSGVFSKSKLDTGSKILIKNAIIKKNSYVLDLGCGIGVIGIIIKIIDPSLKILMTDINNRALELAKKNIKSYNINNEARKSNIFSNIPEKFDVILLNPPIKAGKSVCFKMIDESYLHLNKNGSLQIVVKTNNHKSLFLR